MIIKGYTWVSPGQLEGSDLDLTYIYKSKKSTCSQVKIFSIPAPSPKCSFHKLCPITGPVKLDTMTLPALLAKYSSLQQNTITTNILLSSK